MENQINIAEILKDMPQGTKLYDYLYDREVWLDSISTTGDETAIWCVRNESATETTHFGYSKFGTLRGHEDGLQILLPSKPMRDWTKFALKKGDVLASNDGRKNTIFDGFIDDTYTSFKGKHSLEDNEYIGNENILGTEDYTLEGENPAKCYINTIEKKLGGKLNMETLEVEPIKPKWFPKPFDKVIVRCDNPACIWYADIFSHIDRETLSYVCIGDSWTKCLPYNEETAKLIGTTDNWEG